MLLKLTCAKCVIPALGLVLLVFVFSCGRRDIYAGKYVAQTREPQEESETFIELKEDGEGVWATPDDEVSLRWYVKGDEIRLNTRSGGIIIAKMRHGFLDVELPGPRVISFKRVK